MENLGCITFRATALLVEETASTHASESAVARREWTNETRQKCGVGRPVTCAWRTAGGQRALAILNDRCSRWRAGKTEWRRSYGDRRVSRASALAIDGLSRHKSVGPVEAPRDAEARFDVLTIRERTPRLLRMLEQYSSPEVFSAGVRASTSDRHACGSTRPPTCGRTWGGAAGTDPRGDGGWVLARLSDALAVRRRGGQLVIVAAALRYCRQRRRGRPTRQVAAPGGCFWTARSASRAADDRAGGDAAD